MSSHISIAKSIIILSLLSTAILSSHLRGHADVEAGCTFEGMVGSYPIKLGYFCNNIKKSNFALQNGTPLPRPFKNRMMLYGPPGNGKTTIARKIAQESASKLFELPGPTIVQRYVGQGAQNIVYHFEDAHAHVEKENNTAIIFVDEIDALAKTTGEGREEYLAAAQQLWIELDKIKDDPRIAFIGATNNFDKLNNAFLDRFGSNKIEIKNPDEKTRREVLVHYKKLQTNQDWDQKLLSYIMGKTKDFNIRNLEDLVEDACMIAEISNNSIITEKIILDAVSEIQQKAKDEPSSQEEGILKRIGIQTASAAIAGRAIKIASIYAKYRWGIPA